MKRALVSLVRQRALACGTESAKVKQFFIDSIDRFSIDLVF